MFGAMVRLTDQTRTGSNVGGYQDLVLKTATQPQDLAASYLIVRVAT
jgi:hypothetical protein